MNDVLREYFKDELAEKEKKGRAEGRAEGEETGRLEGRIETLYTDCNMSVSEIAEKVSKPEKYVKEIIKKISAACL